MLPQCCIAMLSSHLLQVKVKKHQAFKAEVHANENALQAVRAHAQELVSADHFASEAISAKVCGWSATCIHGINIWQKHVADTIYLCQRVQVEALDELWQLLLDKADAKADSLKSNQQLLAFKREADEVDSWIETKVIHLLSVAPALRSLIATVRL